MSACGKRKIIPSLTVAYHNNQAACTRRTALPTPDFGSRFQLYFISTMNTTPKPKFPFFHILFPHSTF